MGGVDYVPGTPAAAAWAENVENESGDVVPRTNAEVA
jgi:hypothetical protein